MLVLAQLLVVCSLRIYYWLRVAETNTSFLLVLLVFCHLCELNWVMHEGAQRAAFSVPRKKWNVHKTSVSTGTDLDKEDMRLSAQEIHLTQTVTLGLSRYGYYLQTCLYLLFLFKHQSFLSGTILLPGLAAENAFPLIESHHGLPRVASTQRRGLLKVLSTY